MADQTITPPATPAEYLAAMEPCLKRLGALTAAATKVCQAGPAEDSPAMAEIAVQSRLSCGHWTTPVDNTHSLASIALTASLEHLRAFTVLCRAAPSEVIVYSGLTVLRAALVGGVTGEWLSAPATAEVRVKRGLVERAHGGNQVRRRLAERGTESHADGERIVREVKEGARKHNWRFAFERDRPVIDDERLPSIPNAIEKAHGNRPETGVGKMAWGYLSGIDHAASYALRQSLTVAPKEKAADRDTAFFTASSHHHTIWAICVATVVAWGVDAHARLMGYKDPEWRSEREALRRYRLSYRRTSQDA